MKFLLIGENSVRVRPHKTLHDFHDGSQWRSSERMLASLCYNLFFIYIHVGSCTHIILIEMASEGLMCKTRFVVVYRRLVQNKNSKYSMNISNRMQSIKCCCPLCPLFSLMVVPDVLNMFLPLQRLHKNDIIHFSPHYLHSGDAE